MRALTLLVAVFVSLFVSLALPTNAADDIAAAQSVIRSQEQALGSDDAPGAYSFAAPAIKSLFPEPEIFMDMVRQGYAPVYRHRSFEFGEARTVDGKIAQVVHIIDAEGGAWDALYTLEREPDGSLKITGCVLSKAASA